MGVTWCRLRGLSAWRLFRRRWFGAVFSIWGKCCSYGFGNIGEFDESALPQYPALQAAADHLRAGILAELFNNADA